MHHDIHSYLKSLTNKQLVELLSDVLKERRNDDGVERAYVEAHWCLAEASRMKNDTGLDWGEWEIDVIALPNSKDYPEGWNDQADICQYGQCNTCHTRLTSWAKKAVCSVCGDVVNLT